MAEDKRITTGYIGNALRSAAADHTTTFTDEVYDTERQKYQSEVNTDIQSGIIYDVTANNDGAVFESLSALLSSSNLSILIPISVRHGGMSIRFVQSSDNKYVQYRLMAQNFTTDVTQWQGIDDEPIAGSDNLVKSGGTHLSILNSKNALSFDLLGTTALIGQSKSKLYIYDGTFVEGNSHVMFDVSNCRGKHIYIPSGSVADYHNWGFLADFDYNKRSVVFANSDGIITNTDLTNIEVPDTANYLYVYTGGTIHGVFPHVRVAEGNSLGAIQDIAHKLITGNIHVVGGLVLNTSDKAWFTFENKEKYSHIVIPINAGDSISITKSDAHNIRANYLKDYIPVFVEVPSGKSYGISYTGNTMCETDAIQGSSYEGTAPSDAHYLYVLADYDTRWLEWLPKDIKINGQSVILPSVKKDLEKLEGSIENINKTYKFSNSKFNQIVKDVYIQGEDVDISSVANIRLFIGYLTGGLYYNGFQLRNAGGTTLVSKGIDYPSLSSAIAAVSDGFFDISSFGTNTLGVERIVFAGDFINNAELSEYYDGVLNDSCKNIELCPIIKGHLENETVGIQKASSTAFSLIKKTNEKTLRYHWLHKRWTSEYNENEVVDNDCWSNGSIYRSDKPNVEVAQCNINFIHMFAGGPELHTGSNHGCTVDTKFEIWVDGKLVDFDNMSVNSVIYGKDIHIVQQSDGYYPDRQRTIDNNDGVLDGNRVFAKLDENGNPILAVRWCLDYHMNLNNEWYINKLYVINDNTSFRRIYGAMNCIFPGSDCHTVIINDSDGTVNDYIRENSAWIVTSEHGGNLSTSGGIRLNSATKVVQYGDDFKVETECINDEHPTFGRILPWFAGDTAGGRVKIYHIPVNVTPTETIEGASGTPADVFNSGDVISCHVKRNVSIY